MFSSNLIYGRAWVSDTGDFCELSFWCHELEPMYTGYRPSTDWADNYFHELSLDQLREMFELPEEGCYQVIFSGYMRSYNGGDDDYDYDEEFDLEKFEVALMPEKLVKSMTGVKYRSISTISLNTNASSSVENITIVPTGDR